MFVRLSSSVSRLSSGLRINSAADDAAGLAIREMMRADIATMNQGIRNTADAISMIQTADGALGVIDEKLTRMKELAEQAATCTYTTAQRDIINSEYQAMAAEIDRIANATNFNGIKLLDGSVTNQHGGQGLKIHFGVSNKASEDYYFVNIGDARATSSTGLRVGGDAKNDVWGQGAAAAGPMAGPGCCTAGYDSLDGRAGFVSGETFSYGYNWDWMEDDDADLLSGKYLAGRYAVGSSESLQALINKVNAGSQSRVGVKLDGDALAKEIRSGGTLAVCVGEEAYVFGSAGAAGGTYFVPASAGSPGFKAQGVYKDASIAFNAANGFALNATQINALQNAGVDVAALGLTSGVNISAVASATTAGAASAALVSEIRSQLASLGMFNYQGLTVTASAAPGPNFNVSQNQILAGASGAFDMNNAQGKILPNQAVTINTGIYLDQAGNFTKDSAIANALGMSEMVYRIENPNACSNTWTNSIQLDYSQHLAAGNFLFTAAAHQNLANAGVNVGHLNAAGVHLNVSAGSNIDAAGASAAAFAAAQAQFNAYFSGRTSSITISTIGNGNLANKITAAAMTQAAGAAGPGSAIGTNTAFSMNVTDLWMDENGNYTDSSAVAKALGMGQVGISVSTTPGVVKADLLIGGKNFGAMTFSAQPGDAFTKLASDLSGALQAKFTSLQAAGGKTGGGHLTMASAPAPAPTLTATAIPTANRTKHENSPLQVWHNGQKLTGVAGGSFNNFATNQTLADLTTAVNASIGQIVQSRQGASAGRGLLKASAPPALSNGPSSTADLSANSYSNAATMINVTPAKTVSTTGIVDKSKKTTVVASMNASATNASGISNFGAQALASAINNNKDSQFWAMIQSESSNGEKADMVYIFTKEGGNFNSILACEVAGNDDNSRAALGSVAFENTATSEFHKDGTTLSLGGERWATMKPNQTKANLGNEVWNVTINGRDVGKERDIWIANAGEIKTPALNAGIINGMDRNNFLEVQNAADGDWAGAEVRTQSSAQEALDAISESINKKDKIRADLGSLQNRLENTMVNLTIQAENLQASESRISDVDVATEMTEFTRNNVLTQAATSMLAQANSLSQLALSLIG
jgi:flagellin-like hook-associated protein FlgL